MKNFRILAAALFFLGLAAPAFAQNQFNTAGDPSKTVVGVVAMCLNAQGFAVPTNQSGNCPGGGGSFTGAIFGPTAAGLAAANPPVLIGGTSDGSATGLVGNLKVLGGLAYVNCANCSGSGASAIDGAAFVAGTSLVAPMGSVFNDGLTVLSSGQQGMVRITANRGVHSNLRNAAGAEVGITAAPLRTDPTGTTTQPVSLASTTITGSVSVTGSFFQATQPISAASLPLMTGAATSALQTSTITALGSPFQAGASIGNTTFASTQSGNWTVRNVGVGGATLDFAGQNASGSVNAFLMGGQFNTSPTTITTGNFSPFQLDSAGNLNVNIKAGAGAGGTSSAFAAAFPANGTAIGMTQGGNMVALSGTSGNLNVQCANCSGSGVSTADEATMTPGTSLFAGGGGFFQTTATSNPLTTGQQGMFQVTSTRSLFTNLRNAAGTEIGTAATPIQVSLANTTANATALLTTGTGGTFPATQSGTWNITNISGTISLPTGAATQITSAAILTALGSPFQAGGSIGNTTFAATQATAASLNATVVGTGTFAMQLTGATNNINNIAGTISLPTGAGTAANQTTINTSLGTLHTDLSSLITVAGNPLATQVGAVWIGNVGQNGAPWSVTAALNVTPSIANGNGVVPTQGGAVLSVTNGGYTNLLQANAVLAVGNPLFMTGSGTAGTAAVNPVTVQGIAGMVKLQVTPDSVALPANQSVNVNQIAGSTLVADPCEVNTPTYTPINVSASGSTKIITGTSAKKTYICHIDLVTNAANNVALIEGTVTNCGTGTAGIAGGTTAASGWNFSVNGGISLGMGRYSVNQSATNADDVCLITSAATQLSGGVKWVQQ